MIYLIVDLLLLIGNVDKFNENTERSECGCKVEQKTTRNGACAVVAAHDHLVTRWLC